MSEGTIAGDILHEAGKIAGGTHPTHGPKERSFLAIADMWNCYLGSRKDPTGYISGVDVAQMMVLLKIIRSVQGDPVRDHYADQCGYSAIAGELAL